ncbi:MAG: ATP-binding protein [Acidobacteriota bacterium]|nr:ATP-binding protein [Acidobacteriota bacterium]
MRVRRPRLPFERKIVLIALVAVLPLAIAAVLLTASTTQPQWVVWTIGALTILALLTATALLHEALVHPLRTIANLVGALREEDYALRGRTVSSADTLGEVVLELNALADALRERKLATLEAAALVRIVLDEIDAAVFTFDADTRLELVNRAGERLLGAPAERLIGRTADELGVRELFELTTPATVERALGGVLARWSVRPSEVRRGGRSHRMLVVADITRSLREEEVRAWQRIVQVLGHELNNSLGPIRSIASTIGTTVTREPLPPRWRSDVQRGAAVIERRSDALTRFMRDYAKLARLPEPRKRPVELRALVERCAAIERRLPVRVLAGGDVQLDADPDQLEQLLINLQNNAVDAALETGGGVTVTWQRVDDAVEVSVLDEGAGLHATANLFVPFFTTKPEGSGIGLALSRQIAEAHGGSLMLRNRGDRSGCEALLRLPAR